jgi:hypothetical protein
MRLWCEFYSTLLFTCSFYSTLLFTLQVRDAWLIYDPDDAAAERARGGGGRGRGRGRGFVTDKEVLRACVTVWGSPWVFERSKVSLGLRV